MDLVLILLMIIMITVRCLLCWQLMGIMHHLIQELLDDDLLDVKLSEDGDEEKSPNSSPLLLVRPDYLHRCCLEI